MFLTNERKEALITEILSGTIFSSNRCSSNCLCDKCKKKRTMIENMKIINDILDDKLSELRSLFNNG